jgi:hypothetical protein
MKLDAGSCMTLAAFEDAVSLRWFPALGQLIKELSELIV